MYCDDCDNNKVCKYKEDCMVFERKILNSFDSNKDVFSAKIYCKYKKTEVITNFRVFTHPPTSKK